ncbi:MAG: ABC transporter permease [Actinobacteria bacterium]|nr:ABC transporter permease [Actinomycetota bacterium]
MVKYVLRNMWRRKARTLLTVFGIVVGIFALTVLGALSARLNQQVQGARSWFSSKISVVPSGSSLFGGSDRYLEVSKVGEIEAVPGVKSAVAGFGLLLSDESTGFGTPELIVGADLSRAGDLLRLIDIGSGRILEAGDSGKVVLGSTLAEKFEVGVGDTIELRGRSFEVVGVYQPTLSAPDSFAFVSYQDALDLFREVNPYFQVGDIAATIDVIPAEGVDAEELAARISESVAGIKVISPREAEKQISQFSLIFNAILLGIGFIALVVGGLSIINTMIMSVSERTQEIGLKKALGAGTGSVLAEYLLESALIGLWGGTAGMLCGLLAVLFLNRATAASNVTIFTVTPTVVLGPVIFAVFLGTAAGLFPAYRAARLRPVEALKED